VAYRVSWPVVFLAAGTLLLVSPIPVHSGPVGAKTCGPFASRAPSTVGFTGTGMVSMVRAIKDATVRDAVICLINAERRSDPTPPLTPRFADLYYASVTEFTCDRRGLCQRTLPPYSGDLTSSRVEGAK
jgi:hypothetical protein